ncbi:hypothetical protein [Verrucomicrobium sp. BvORR034]|uniref:hypothetical protein n=1 Tax=Verrucomicrobium sp. BvORR034 TaxID=1396418 RepID=UPI002240F1EF|nr:hypothetical protein [Verrucomicrobium sp. BvORR034]
MPIANRRHSRLPICATSVLGSDGVGWFEFSTGLPKSLRAQVLFPEARVLEIGASDVGGSGEFKASR